MNIKKIIVIIICCFYYQTILAQKLSTEQKERLEYKVALFSTNDKELQELWYEDRMDEMKLAGDIRKDYKKIVIYHVYKMERLGRPDAQLNDDEIRHEFPKQIRKLHKDVEELLTPKQLEIHKKSWDAILKAIYQQRNWKLTN
ncbi:hypothetical protein [uncultured Tenacibaculum sp.]|uniref:hypothetical protein n=1 Tax=uncultured Tenacibaculum sp. TaxID=174713 RepID=UPI00262DDD53|nr:hypothetical protein [uncultured Tenacibaculum sp.]